MVVSYLEEICKNSGATPLTGEDEPEFRKKVKMERPLDNLDFKDSWAYTLQASRNLPYKIQDKETLIILGANDNGESIVVPNYFISNNEKLRDSLEKITEQGVPVVLKNVDLSQAKDLKKLGFEDYHEKEGWNKECKYDDQTFPQRIVNIESLLSLEGSDYRELRRELRRFRESDKEVLVRSYNLEDRGNVEELLRIREKDIHGFYDAHKLFLLTNLGKDFLQLVFEINKKIEGFTLCDKISDKCIAYNCVAHNPEVPHLSSFIVYETVKESQKKGYKYFNFQGSETSDLDHWKEKFNPQESIEKLHLVLRN